MLTLIKEDGVVALPGSRVHNSSFPERTCLESGIKTVYLRFGNIKSSLAFFVGYDSCLKGSSVVEPSPHIGKLSRKWTLHSYLLELGDTLAGPGDLSFCEVPASRLHQGFRWQCLALCHHHMPG